MFVLYIINLFMDMKLSFHSIGSIVWIVNCDTKLNLGYVYIYYLLVKSNSRS